MKKKGTTIHNESNFASLKTQNMMMDFNVKVIEGT